MESQLSLSIIEIIVLMLGAILVGVTIHFFISSRRSLNAASPAAHQLINQELSQWKLKYFNEIESMGSEITGLKEKLADTEENSHIFSIEAEENRKENKRLQAELSSFRAQSPAPGKPGYIDQLTQTQAALREYQEKMNQLLGQIDIVKEVEEKQHEVLKNNEELGQQVDELKMLLEEKEKQIIAIQQKQALTNEMNSMLDSAYNEFNILQEKLHKLEGQASISRRLNIEYEDLKEEHARISRDHSEFKHKYSVSLEENKELRDMLRETEDKLREANFQRQQLQKKVAYLEELNNDMQAIADANKKLEGQLKRIGELESRLNMIAEERDELARKRYNV